MLPYLQQPRSDSMTVNFFSETGSNAKITVKGPGLPKDGVTLDVKGVRNPVSKYQDSELKLGDRTQPGGATNPLTAKQGSWIRASEPYKYSQQIKGLLPGSKYTYTVELDGYTHKATFKTNPPLGKGFIEKIKLIAFSDTETDPVGRVTFREWVKSPLTKGSEARPDAADSAWAKKFGTNKRDGENQLRYAMTEDMGQKYNNLLIKKAQPDLLLIPGDIAERASFQTHWDEWFRYFAGDEAAILDTIPTITSLGNHEVYGYCKNADDCTDVIRARAQYNWNFDTNHPENSQYRDAFHRTDYGPVTVISIDSTNGTDQTPRGKNAPNHTGNDATLTPDKYGTDTQNAFNIEQYKRDYPKAVANGWWDEDADPNKPDQPNFMPGSDQYKWLEAQLADARAKGQAIFVQWHHVAYSNGTHGTTMHHAYSDAQPGTPMRHLQPLLEKYNVVSVFSGHDETFQASYVDEAKDGTGVYHWDVGVASDGLRGEKMIKNPADPNGPYVPLAFNTHSIWMAQRDEPETWHTNEAGVKHLVSGGKHYGYLDIQVEPYTGKALASGVMPAAIVTMTPVSAFPILNDNYDLVEVQARKLTSGIQIVYLDAQGRPLNPNAQPGNVVVTPLPTENGGKKPQPSADGKTTVPAHKAEAGTINLPEGIINAAATGKKAHVIVELDAAKANAMKDPASTVTTTKADVKKDSAATATTGKELANTGASIGGSVELAALLLGLGGVAVAARRKKA
ncbi:metallophosphoesterase [Arcanobacterium hippocoleae]|uniref:metallophosphoesterase n=1 Tax=Arcanobacterium hippocoleae TaxID=149017 RepID=UPI003341A931